MYHSINFYENVNDILLKNGNNTWGDWHLVPSSRPVFSPPSPKT